MRRFMFLAAMLAVLPAIAKPIDWEQEKEVQPGVKLCRLELTEPRLLKVSVMRIDLKTPGLRFTGTKRPPEWGRVMDDYTNKTMYVRTKRVKTADFMMEERKAGRNVIAAFNSAPWGPWVAPFTHKYGDPHGLNISEGVVISDHRHKTDPIFVAWKNGTCAITNSIPADRYGEVQVAHTGFEIIMQNGVVTQAAKARKELNPRMAYGLSADKRWMYVMAADGRQPGWSLGATLTDLCAIMADAGAADALNMDGGGSTTLLYWDGKKPVMANRHNASGTLVRKNGASIAIYLENRPPNGAK